MTEIEFDGKKWMGSVFGVALGDGGAAEDKASGVWSTGDGLSNGVGMVISGGVEAAQVEVERRRAITAVDREVNE